LTQQERWTVTEAALTVYKAFGLVDYARIDVRFADGVPYVVDVNEVPELALDTGFCYSALQAGYSYEDVIEKILNIALKREGIQ
jgi:D-alanine-D-alanine ligase